MADRLLRLEKVCRQNPDSPLFARLADLYLRRGMVSRALELCEKGCERFPDYNTGFQILSKCYKAQGELEEARRALDRALDLDPENPGGFKQLSRIYQDLGIADMALKSLEQAARLDPLDQDLGEQVDQLAYELRVESTSEPEEALDILPEEAPDSALVEVDTETDQVDYPEQEPGGAVDVEEPGLNDPLQDFAEESVLAEEVDAQPEEPAEVTCEAEFSADQPDAGELDDGGQPDAGELDDGGQPDAGELDDADQLDAEELDELDDAGQLAAGELDDGGVNDVASQGAQIFTERPEASPEAETGQDESVSDSRIDEDLQEEDSRTEKREEAVSPTAAEEDVEVPVPQKPASRSRHQSGSVNTVSGLAPRDDDELLRIFQEIEAEQTQETASDSSSSTGESGLSSSEVDGGSADAEDPDRQIATVTLAEIYTIQGLTKRAIDTYEQIVEQDPGNEMIQQKLADLKKGTKNQ